MSARRSSADDDEDDELGSIEEQIEAERERLFRAMAIVDACRLASQSFLADKNEGGLDYNYALLAAHDLMNDAAGELEMIGSRSRSATPTKPRRQK